MKLTQDSSDKATLKELGDRLSRYRLNRNQTQEAGVSLRTLIRIEGDESVQLTNLIRVLRALGLLGNLEALIPSPPLSPIQQVRMQGKQRQRASSAPDEPDRKKPWTWGDEQ